MTVSELQSQLHSLIPWLQAQISSLKAQAATVVGAPVGIATITPATFYQNQWLPLQNTLFSAQAYANQVSNWAINDENNASLGIGRKPFPPVPSDVAAQLARMTGSSVNGYSSIQGVVYAFSNEPTVPGFNQPGPISKPTAATTSKGAPTPATVSATDQPGKNNLMTVDPLSIQAEQRPGTGTMEAGGKPFSVFGNGPSMNTTQGESAATAASSSTSISQNLLSAFLQGISLWFEHPATAAGFIGGAVSGAVSGSSDGPTRAYDVGVVALPAIIAWLLFFRKK